jgi:hypothetical protein
LTSLNRVVAATTPSNPLLRFAALFITNARLR